MVTAMWITNDTCSLDAQPLLGAVIHNALDFFLDSGKDKFMRLSVLLRAKTVCNGVEFLIGSSGAEEHAVVPLEHQPVSAVNGDERGKATQTLVARDSPNEY